MCLALPIHQPVTRVSYPCLLLARYKSTVLSGRGKTFYKPGRGSGQRDSQTARQTDRHTERQAGRQAGRQEMICSLARRQVSLPLSVADVIILWQHCRMLRLRCRGASELTIYRMAQVTWYVWGRARAVWAWILISSKCIHGTVSVVDNETYYLSLFLLCAWPVKIVASG